MPWWRSASRADASAMLSIYVGSTLVKTYSTIGSDYDYGNVSLDLSSSDPTGQQIKLAFYGGGDIIYYLYNINLKKNGQYVKFTPWTVASTTASDGSVHYDNSWKEDRIVATLEDTGWINFTTATIATAPELQINPSGLTFNKTIYSINQGNSLQANATVDNIGSATDSGVVVKLYINDVLTSTSASQSIATGASATYSFTYTANFAGKNRIKVTVQAVPSGTEGMTWNNNATKYILKHPYFYTTNFSNSPAVIYAGQQPYSSWLSSLLSDASYELNYDYSSPNMHEDAKALYAMKISLYGNINGLATYQNATMTALLNIGNGRNSYGAWVWLNRSFAGNTVEGTGGYWNDYNSSGYIEDFGANWGQITEGYAMAYDWDAPYIISYDTAHGTNYMTTIRDNLAHICQDSYLTDKEIYAYPSGDRNTIDNWGDWGTGKLAKEGGTGVCAMALLDYDGQYQDVERMDEAVKFVGQDLFKQDSKLTGAPESLIQIQTTEDGIFEEGGGYHDYHEPTTSYFMALYKSTFNQSLGDIYPLAYGYATWLLMAVAPTGQYPQMTTSYACPWYPQVNYYLSLNPTDTADYNLGTWFTNYSIVPDKGYRGSGTGTGCGGDYGGYPELLLGYNASSSMATPTEPSYFFPHGTGAVLRGGYARNDTYSYMRSAQNHTMSGHSAGTTQQLVFDIWAKGAYLIPDSGNPRFLGDSDDEALRIVRTTMLVNCSTCNWVTDGWTAIERDTKGTYGAMDNPSSITTNLFSNNLDYVEGNMTVNYYQNISGSDAYAHALPTPYSWTRGEMLVDNNYIITFDRLSSAASRDWGMMIPFGDTNGHTDANPAFNYARGNLTIDGTDYRWYDRVNGNPTPFSVANAQKIGWKSTSETNTVDTVAYPVNMTVFLNPTSNIDEISGHMHYGNYGVNYEWHVPLVRVKQSGTNIKYLTIYYPTGLGDAQPAITNLTVTGGSGNDYATRVIVGDKTDVITFSDGEVITAGPVSTDAQASFSREQNGLSFFFMRSGKKFSYNGVSRVELSSAADNLLYTYHGENRSINISGSGSTDITLNDLRTDFTYIVYRDGFAYPNWRMNNGGSMTITTTLSSHSFEIVANGNYPPSVTLNSPTNNANLSSTSVSFNCSASDSSGLANISLWYDLGGWKQIASTNLTGTSASASWNISNLTEGAYSWNCKAFAALGASAFAYANNTFTISIQCNESWSCSLWSACINGTQSRTCTDSDGCNTTFNKPAEIQFCTSPGCTENWNCTLWSACINSTQSRTCNDLNDCNTTLNKPSENQSCIVGGCTENWNCTLWSACINSTQSRTCNDLNDCNTTLNKPAQNQSCTPVGCTENWVCSYWSACIYNQQTRSCTDTEDCNTTINKPLVTQSCNSAPQQGGGGYHGGGSQGGGGTIGCYESWSCDDWSDCSDGKQTRSCTDSSHCGTSKSKPPETQPCASDIDIETLPSEIRINNGSSVDFELTASVKGTESNLKLNITGLPDDWFSITPEKFDSLTDKSVNYSVRLSIPSNANGTRDIQFQLMGAHLNSSVYTTSLVIVVPSAQRCSLLCKGNMILDIKKCTCACNITCPRITDLDAVSCICKNSKPISNVPITPPPQRQEPKYAVITPTLLAVIILALQLVWIMPLTVLLRLKRII